MQQLIKATPKSTLALALGLLLYAGSAGAQMFKWTDANGVVHFSDQPPRDNAKVERKAITGGARGAGLPYALAEAVRKSPVVLYTASPCGPCDQGRALLQQRGIPFAEKTVSSDEDKRMLAAAGGGDDVPMLLVGNARRVGFQASAWNEALSNAAYPSRGMLPANYKNLAAGPAAPPHAPAPEVAIDPVAQPLPAPHPPAPDTPAGFRF